MKTIVLDTTELRRDWTLTGLTLRLLGHASWQTFVDVRIPAVCVEELISHHRREVMKADEQFNSVARTYRRLGVAAPEAPFVGDYRRYVEERLDEHLGFAVLPIPHADHADLVRRAVGRIPPFDDKGSGYRDSLVWANVLELAGAGADVVLVTADRIFRADNGELAAPLRLEVDSLQGRVQVVTELTPWLLENLPWRSTTVADAVAIAQDEEFAQYFDASDFQDEMQPEAEHVGFDRAPYAFRVDDIQWTVGIERTGSPRSTVGADVVEYDITGDVTFEAVLPNGTYVETGWELQHVGDRLHVRGTTSMTAGVIVLFGHNMAMEVENVDWRRYDAGIPGPGVEPDEPQTPLFDF
ncbi:PIN domain-containing protein [Curtobacterium sp. VKM Ac-1376]|uniref:PIN domain-containing protein n=1 Tax=Curtobacterium sp. VKM Ac-1376 TaxID=123312 RepID=UPI00188CDB61|nr:PIN domain-containing protein [Curtobacterium sp. VKM Ac-1376]MBF4615486.1 DUF4935 domain-containing protein [Curtobacterium sp. VKM Ac-1376]